MTTLLAALLLMNPAKTLVDYFRPMRDHNPVAKDVGGLATVEPHDPKNRLKT